MKKTQHQNNDEIASDEVDLMELISFIWSKRKTIYITTAVFIVFGLLITLGSFNYYKSEVKLLPELNASESGVSSLMKQFGGLSSLAGINLGSINQTEALNPTLYPEIVNSTPLMIKLLNTEIQIPSQNTSATLYTYMVKLKRKSMMDIVKKYTIGLPGTIKKSLSGDELDSMFFSINEGPIRMNLNVSETIKDLKECVESNVNLKTGIITISAEFNDPEVAAQVAQLAMQYLTEFITQYRIEKVRKNLDFITEQYEIAQSEFEKAQLNLANFQDQNKNIISARIEGQKDRLQAQYDLTFNVYNSLSQQREQAKIKVQDETPVFKVLNPMQVPVEKSRPKRSIIMIVIAFMGGVTGIGLIFFNKIYSSLKEEPV